MDGKSLKHTMGVVLGVIVLGTLIVPGGAAQNATKADIMESEARVRDDLAALSGDITDLGDALIALSAAQAVLHNLSQDAEEERAILMGSLNNITVSIGVIAQALDLTLQQQDAILTGTGRVREDLADQHNLTLQGFNNINGAQEANFELADKIQAQNTYLVITSSLYLVTLLILGSAYFRKPRRLWVWLNRQRSAVEDPMGVKQHVVRAGDDDTPIGMADETCMMENEGLQYGDFNQCSAVADCPIARDCQARAIKNVEEELAEVELLDEVEEVPLVQVQGANGQTESEPDDPWEDIGGA